MQKLKIEIVGKQAYNKELVKYIRYERSDYSGIYRCNQG